VKGAEVIGTFPDNGQTLGSRVARKRHSRYSSNEMEDTFSAYQEFSSSAATATKLMTDFSVPPGGSEPSWADVERTVGFEWKLTDELGRGLSSAEQVLEEAPQLDSLKALKAELSALQKKYAAWLKQWRQGGGRELTPPVLWRRLERTNKALKRLYQDVCDHIVFEEVKAEEVRTIPPGKLEELVRAAHQEEGGKDPH